MKSLHRNKEQILKVVRLGHEPKDAYAQYLVKSNTRDAKGRPHCYDVIIYRVPLTSPIAGDMHCWKFTCHCKGAESGYFCKHVSAVMRKVWPSGASIWYAKEDAKRQHKRYRPVVVQGANSRKSRMVFVTNRRRGSEKCSICGKHKSISKNPLCGECTTEQTQLRLDHLDEQLQARRPL